MSFKFDASKLIKGIAEREIKTRAALGLYADTFQYGSTLIPV